MPRAPRSILLVGRHTDPAEACDLADAARLSRQRRVLAVATGLLGVSVFVAYAPLP